MKLSRLFHTVRHLRAQQIAGQFTHRARRLIEDPAKVQRWRVPPYPGCRWTPIKEFLAPNTGTNSEASIKSGTLTFLNRSHPTGFPPDWQSASELSKLWRYNLHYHDFLWQLNRTDALAVIDDWIARHVPARGAEGWEPYPTSLRLMNWCALLDRAQLARVWPSVYRQAEWLLRHLETHLLGNHLLENAAALAMVGSCFDGPDARRWFTVGINLLREQLAEQVLPDGGHFERSPMYHTRVVYVLSQLRNTGNLELGAIVSGTLDRAVAALKVLCHPDGQIALFNDSAFGIANDPAELLAYLDATTRTPPGNFALPDTGYFGARTESRDYIICDAGPIGPDHQPGHAHGDIFSFELSFRGHRVITDTGVFNYDRGALRDYCRSTAAHNTVELFERDQCEFWGVFRVANRARITPAAFQMSPDGFRLTSEHDGYQRLRNGAIHHREIRWNREGEVVISDRVSGGLDRAAEFVSRFHLHPSCVATSVPGKREVQVQYSAGHFVIRFDTEGSVRLERTQYCPEFGRQIERTTVRFSPSRVEDARRGITVHIAHAS